MLVKSKIVCESLRYCAFTLKKTQYMRRTQTQTLVYDMSFKVISFNFIRVLVLGVVSTHMSERQLLRTSSSTRTSSWDSLSSDRMRGDCKESLINYLLTNSVLRFLTIVHFQSHISGWSILILFQISKTLIWKPTKFFYQERKKGTMQIRKANTISR